MLLMLTMLSSCQKNKVFYHFENTEYGAWDKNNKIEFDIPTLERSGNYAMLVGLRITNAYPFQNLHMIVNTKHMPSGKTTTENIICKVTDRNGKILGKGVSLYQYRIPVRKEFFMDGDSVHVSVTHNMKRETLPGIMDVGLELSVE